MSVVFADAGATAAILAAVIGPTLGLVGVLAGVVASRRTSREASIAASRAAQSQADTARAASDVDAVRAAQEVLRTTITELRTEVDRKNDDLVELRESYEKRLASVRSELDQVTAKVRDMDAKYEATALELTNCRAQSRRLVAELERLKGR